MTENCGAGTRILPSDPTSGGTIGFPHACNELKLVDVPSMNYLATDKPNPRGEICARGPGVFKGYYKGSLLTLKDFPDTYPDNYRSQEYCRGFGFGGMATFWRRRGA
jgi:long-subunit acyl-CoA synthetase (AMP-forming)